jgi:hypothetical protein
MRQCPCLREHALGSWQRSDDSIVHIPGGQSEFASNEDPLLSSSLGNKATPITWTCSVPALLEGACYSEVQPHSPLVAWQEGVTTFRIATL